MKKLDSKIDELTLALKSAQEAFQVIPPSKFNALAGYLNRASSFAVHNPVVDDLMEFSKKQEKAMQEIELVLKESVHVLR